MKFICIGRNYAKHIQELQHETPKEPVFFLKPDSAITRCNRPFFLPDFSERVDYETEIIVKIKDVSVKIPVGAARGMEEIPHLETQKTENHEKALP